MPEFCEKNGFRFYTPLQKIGKPNGKSGDDTSSTISPLGTGTEFVGKLRYFNLTKAELGLVLLCLTALDSTQHCHTERSEVSLKDCYYKFGGAKFYGYGDAQILLNGIDESLKNECINAYKNLLAKTDFDLKSRIKELCQKSKKQDFSQSNNLQNPHCKSHESALQSLDSRNDSQNDDWNGL